MGQADDEADSRFIEVFGSAVLARLAIQPGDTLTVLSVNLEADEFTHDVVVRVNVQGPNGKPSQLTLGGSLYDPSYCFNTDENKIEEVSELTGMGYEDVLQLLVDHDL